MSSGDEIDSVDVAEVVGDFWAEDPACASSIYGPVFNVLRVRPHEVAEWTLVGDLYFSIYCSDLVDCLYLWTQAAVDAECLSVNDGSDWQIVEYFGAVFPWVGVAVFSVDFIIKSIYCCDLSSVKKIIYLDSWFPLKSVILSGYFTFKHKRYSKVSTEW